MSIQARRAIQSFCRLLDNVFALFQRKIATLRRRTTRSRVGFVFSTQPGDRYSTFTSYQYGIRHSLHAEILVGLLSFLVFLIGWLLWSRESIASDCCDLSLGLYWFDTTSEFINAASPLTNLTHQRGGVFVAATGDNSVANFVGLLAC